MKIRQFLVWALVAAGLTSASSALAQQTTVPAPFPGFGQRTGAAPAQLRDVIAGLGESFGKTASISVRDVSEGWTISYNPARLCPQQSVSKLWVALTVFDQIDNGRLRLDDAVHVGPDDLTLFHQPIRDLVGETGFDTTIGDLLDRALTESDNTANDVLLRQVGGPDAVRAALSARNINNIRFGPGERQLQSRIAGIKWHQDLASKYAFEKKRKAIPQSKRRALLKKYAQDPVDGASAEAITATLARLVRGELLSSQSTNVLLNMMSASKTGHLRLSAAIEPGWQLIHKTGTGQSVGSLVAGFNDVGVLMSPDGHQYAVAVMIADSTQRLAKRQKLIADVARTVMQHWASAARGG